MAKIVGGVQAAWTPQSRHL